MTLRTKTIEYAFDCSTSSLAAATRRDLSAITLYSPETSSRTFKSAIIVLHARQNDTTAISMTSWLIGIKLGAVAFDDVTITDTITHSGETSTWQLVRDVTSYFNTNFGSGSSQTCQVGFQFGAVSTVNISVKLILTYEYDDASATTRIKTVRIPLESFTGRLTTTMTEMGTNQVPALDTFLTEASKTYREIFFEVYANEASTTTTNTQLNHQLDNEANAFDGSHVQNQNSSMWYWRTWVRNDMATNVTHAFKASSQGVSNVYTNLAVILVVTYEYDHSSSTTPLNTLLLPAICSGSSFGGTAAGDKSRQKFEFWIEEPGTITLVQSGLLCYFNADNTVACSILAGSQTARTYTATQGTIQCGGYSFIHRIDAGGGAGSAGITLARGLNTLTVDWYAGAQVIGQAGTNMTALLCLNYTSGKASAGDGVHNHTTVHTIATTAANATNGLVESSSVAPYISESSRWVNGFAAVAMVNRTASTQGGGISIEAEYQSGEGPADGWAEVFNSMLDTEDELGIYIEAANASPYFRRHPNDPDPNRMSVTTARKWRIYATGIHWSALLAYVTHHAITYSAAGTVSAYTGAGSGITVNIHRSDTDEKVQTATTSSGGTYSATWYDNTVAVYSVARQDSTHVGRSDNAVAA